MHQCLVKFPSYLVHTGLLHFRAAQPPWVFACHPALTCGPKKLLHVLYLSKTISADRLPQVEEDVRGQDIPDKLWGNHFLNKVNTTPGAAQMKCHKCDHMNKEGKCLKGEGVCFPKFSEECMTKKVYEGGKLQHIVLGCEVFCWSTSFSFRNNEVQFQCCQDKPLCNVP
ncbi:acrosomal protein SP-10-like [Notamacropus eugenii]|uniref:acrosomal protein SP-10-like n=1 Tax=Notamacropus eugenii TaxID=9315 RepID=UPI003B670F1F